MSTPVGEQAAGPFVTKVVPAQVDVPELFLVPPRALDPQARFEAVREQLQRLPGRLNQRLVGARRMAEHEGVGPERRPAFEHGSDASLGIERDAPVLLVLRRCAGDTNLARVPVHALVLDQQHLAATTAEFERSDDAIVECLADVLMPRRVHHAERCLEQPALLVARDAAIADRLGLLVETHAEPMERRAVEQWGCLRQSPVDRRAQPLEHAMHRRDLDVFGVVGARLEPVDLVGVFKRLEGQVAQVLLQDADLTAHRVDAAEPRRFDQTVHVRVQERRHVGEFGAGLHRATRGPPRIAASLDLADEAPFPVAGFFH